MFSPYKISTQLIFIKSITPHTVSMLTILAFRFIMFSLLKLQTNYIISPCYGENTAQFSVNLDSTAEQSILQQSHKLFFEKSMIWKKTNVWENKQ